MKEAAAMMQRLQDGDAALMQFADMLAQSKCLDDVLIPEEPNITANVPDLLASSTPSACPSSSAVACIASLNFCDKLANNEQDVLAMISSACVDILAVQESLYATALNVPGYFWLAPQRPEQSLTVIASRCAQRGIGFLVCSKYRSLVEVCKKRIGQESIESFWIKICGKDNFLDTYVCCVYAPGP